MSARQHSLQVAEEGMVPLQGTPLPRRAPSAAAAPPAAYDPNMTFEVPDGEDQTAADSRSAVPAGVSAWQGSDPAEPHLSTAVGSVPSTSRGLKVPSLPDRKCAKPLYMALTSAAIGKRKLNSGIKEEDETAVVAFKRVKLEPAVTKRPLRVQPAAGSDENKPRRVVRGKSEGMLNERGACKSSSTFYKTAQPFKPFKRVIKKM